MSDQTKPITAKIKSINNVLYIKILYNLKCFPQITKYEKGRIISVINFPFFNIHIFDIEVNHHAVKHMIVYLPEGIIRIDNIIEAKKLFSALEKFIEFESGKELLNLVDQEINSKPHIPTMKFLSPKKEEINVFIES